MINPAGVTAAHPFCCTAADQPLFWVADGVPIADALIQSSEYLRGALATNAEIAESSSGEMAALSAMVGHSIQMAQALLEASIRGLEHPSIQSS